MSPDPTYAFVEGLYCPTLDFLFAFLDYDYVWHIILYSLQKLSACQMSNLYLSHFLTFDETMAWTIFELTILQFFAR
jgi:hypothetical protein